MSLISSMGKPLHQSDHPLFRSYGAILPSSLTRVISRALAYSACLPVSDCGTNSRRHLASPAISWQCGISLFASSVLLAPHPPSPLRATGLARDIQYPGRPSPLRHRCHSSASPEGAGILTGCPSPTPFGLSLGSPNPGRTNLPQEPLDFRRTDFSSVFSLLIPGSSLLPRPAVLAVRLHSTTARSPTTAPARRRVQSTASVTGLVPIIVGAQRHRPVSYYALFKWWLPLSQHPGCLSHCTSFVT